LGSRIQNLFIRNCNQRRQYRPGETSLLLLYKFFLLASKLPLIIIFYGIPAEKILPEKLFKSFNPNIPAFL